MALRSLEAYLSEPPPHTHPTPFPGRAAPGALRRAAGVKSCLALPVRLHAEARGQAGLPLSDPRSTGKGRRWQHSVSLQKEGPIPARPRSRPAAGPSNKRPAPGSPVRPAGAGPSGSCRSWARRRGSGAAILPRPGAAEGRGQAGERRAGTQRAPTQLPQRSAAARRVLSFSEPGAGALAGMRAAAR